MRTRGEVGVTYKRGNEIVSVEQIDGFGKMPGLWIGTEKPNELLKVASFGSVEKAEKFCKWFEYMIGLEDHRQGGIWE